MVSNARGAAGYGWDVGPCPAERAAFLPPVTAAIDGAWRFTWGGQVRVIPAKAAGSAERRGIDGTAVSAVPCAAANAGEASRIKTPVRSNKTIPNTCR
jgi:hypothetical protein